MKLHTLDAFVFILAGALTVPVALGFHELIEIASPSPQTIETDLSDIVEPATRRISSWAFLIRNKKRTK